MMLTINIVGSRNNIMTNYSPTLQLSAGLSVGDYIYDMWKQKLLRILPRLPCWGERLSKATEHWFNVQILLEILNWLPLLGKGKGKDNH